MIFHQTKADMKRVILWGLILLIAGAVQLRAQNGFLYVYPATPQAYPTGAAYNPGSPTFHAILNGLFQTYGVTGYAPAFVGAEHPSLQGVHYLELTGDAFSFQMALEATGLFSRLEVLPLFRPDGCDDPVETNDPYGDNTWWLQAMEAPCAWTLVNGDPSRPVAVVDTPVNTEHEDLAGKIVSVTGYGLPYPGCDHGTGIAGAIAAIPDNGTCETGVGFETTVAHYPVEAFPVSPGGLCGASGAKLMEAVWSAFQEGREVINLSWSGMSPSSSQTLTDMVQEMVNGGTNLVVSAGGPDNDGTHTDYADIPGVLKVSLTDSSGGYPWAVPRDPDVDISAPGKRVHKLYYDNACAFNIAGTSIATAFVSGIASLVRDANPCLEPAEVENILKATANPVWNGDEPGDPFYGTVGAGLVNAHQAVLYALGEIPPLTADETWTTPRYLAGILYVEPGVRLTIQTRVRFSAGAGIVVKPGAELILDGAELTAGCNGRWRGVEVWGTGSCANCHQFLVNGVRQQGYVEIRNNSLIEQAEVGLRLTPTDLPGDGGTGGMVNARDSRFRNNWRSVWMDQFQNQDPETGAPVGNLSSFANCRFEADQTYLPGDPFDSHVHLWQVDGLDFHGCRFSSLFDQASGYGIRSLDAGYSVDEWCAEWYPAGQSCLPEDLRVSEFQGFVKGIWAMGTGVPKDISIKNTRFALSRTGIDINLVHNVVITDCRFEVQNLEDPPLPGSWLAGIILRNSTGFEVSRNEILQIGFSEWENIVGLIVINSGIHVNEVSNNFFQGLSIACLANQKNRNPFDPYSGLVFRCNHFTGNLTDIAVPEELSSSGIADFQGTPDEPAGNIFSDNALNILNQTPWEIKYHYGPGQEPAQVQGNVLLSPANAEADCPEPMLPPGSTAEMAGDIKKWLSKHYDLKHVQWIPELAEIREGRNPALRNFAGNVLNFFHGFDLSDPVVFPARVITNAPKPPPQEITWQIGPNPAYERVLIQASFCPPGSQIEVADWTGRVVWATAASEEMEIQLDKLPPGIYVFRLVAGGRVLLADKVALIH